MSKRPYREVFSNLFELLFIGCWGRAMKLLALR
jgi:hypothetical protein